MKKLLSKRPSYRYPSGLTSRITVSIVAEDILEDRVDSPEKIYDYYNKVIATQPDYEPEKENVCVILCNTRFKAFAWNRVSLGTVDQSYCMPRDVLRPVICGGAYGFVLVHNHPSGDPSPSRADSQITNRIVDASGIMQIRMLDHIIIGKPAACRTPYYSFREAGLIP